MIFVLLASIALNIILIGAVYYVLGHAGDPGLEIIVRAQEKRIAEQDLRIAEQDFRIAELKAWLKHERDSLQ